jgi:hypothetical protein
MRCRASAAVGIGGGGDTDALKADEPARRPTRRLREERVLHLPAGYEAGRLSPTRAGTLSKERPAGEVVG